MKEGVRSTEAEIIVFFDADLIGLKTEHISLLIQPVLKNKAAMSVGLRERWGGLPKFFVNIDPLLALGGERAMRRFVFENIPERFIQGFAVETALDYYCQKKKLPVSYVELKGLNVIIKERKWGLLRGFLNRIKMISQLIRIRFLILINRKEF